VRAASLAAGQALIPHAVEEDKANLALHIYKFLEKNARKHLPMLAGAPPFPVTRAFFANVLPPVVNAAKLGDAREWLQWWGGGCMHHARRVLSAVFQAVANKEVSTRGKFQPGDGVEAVVTPRIVHEYIDHVILQVPPLHEVVDEAKYVRGPDGRVGE